jgi:hypothetical protein
MSADGLRASITESALIEVYDHWNKIREDRLMPGWRDIDPSAIKEHLPIVWSWRWDPELGTFVGRLAGEDIVSVLGGNTRGKRLEDCFRPDAREVVLARYRRVMEEPAMMLSEGKVFLPTSAIGYGVRIVLPLGADGTNGDGILGATVYQLGMRPKSSDKFSIDHHGENLNFIPLMST